MFACGGHEKKWLGRCRGTPTPFDFLMTTQYLTQRRLVCHSAPPLSLCRMSPHRWHSSRGPSALPAASCTSLGRMANWKPGQPPWRLRHTHSVRRIVLEGMLRRTVRRSLWVWRSRWSRQMCLQTSTAAPEELHRSGTLSRSRTPRWRTREKKRPHRLTMPRDALPTHPSSFRLLTGCSLEAIDITVHERNY